MIDDIVQNAARRVVVDLYLFVQTVDQFAANAPINRGSMMLPFEPCPKFLRSLASSLSRLGNNDVMDSRHSLRAAGHRRRARPSSRQIFGRVILMCDF
jgi:hypothetical protein